MQEICHDTREAYIILIDICHITGKRCGDQNGHCADRIVGRIGQLSEARCGDLHILYPLLVELIRYIWEGNGRSGSWVTWMLSCRRPSFHPF